jgi:hypothetical protein
MVSGIQVIALIFALAQGYFTYVQWKKREFTLREFLAWEAVWITFAITTLFPRQIALLAGDLGTFRPLDFFTILGFMLVLLIAFRTYVEVDRVRKTLEKTIRDLALEDIKEK